MTSPVYKKCNLLLFALLLMAASPAVAEISFNVSGTQPVTTDPGNEVSQNDIEFSAKKTVYSSKESKSDYAIGLGIKRKQFTFDDPQLPNVNLLKTLLPLTYTKVLSSNTGVQATLVPGLHGETGEMRDAEFRVEGSVTFLLPRGTHTWVIGAGYSDAFGKLQAFPILGAIWVVNDKMQLNLVFPSFQAEYKQSPSLKLSAFIEPAGGQWLWEPGTVGNRDEGKIELTATQLGIGAKWLFSESTAVVLRGGLETGRKFKVTNTSTGATGSVALDDAVFLRLGMVFQ